MTATATFCNHSAVVQGFDDRSYALINCRYALTKIPNNGQFHFYCVAVLAQFISPSHRKNDLLPLLAYLWCWYI